MNDPRSDRAVEFRNLHRPGDPLVLANVWDAGSARLFESAGARAIATTSSGVAWSRGYADGDRLPPRVLATAAAEIARVIAVPLTVDAEGGYSNDPRAVGEVVAALLDAGAVGVNLEDGSGSPDLLCAKIAAARESAVRARVALFVNARTDVFLRELVPAERAVDEVVERARRYRAAGADGIFVPRLAAPAAIRAIASSVDLPLNVMVVPNLPPVAELGALGVARVSAGSAIAQASLGLARRAACELLDDGLYGAMFESSIAYGEMNALFSPPAG